MDKVMTLTATGLLFAMVVSPSRGETVGWSGDGQNHYAGATPPTAFSIRYRRQTDPESGKEVKRRYTEGVVWVATNLYFGHAQPVVAGNLVLINVDLYQLVALDLKDGSERWRADHDQREFLDPEDQKQLDVLRAELDRAKEVRRGFGKRVETLRKQLAAKEPDYLESDTWNHLFAKRRRKVAKGFEPTPPADPGLATTFRELLADKRTFLLSNGKWGWGMKVDELECQRRLADEFNDFGVQSDRWETLIGAGFATPLAEDDRIWVAYANNVVACHDPRGKRLWAKWDKASRTDRAKGKPLRVMEFCPSPILADDLLIVAQDHDRIRAYDKTTGEKRWEAERPRRSGWAGGSPAVMRLGDTTLIVAANGYIYRAADGTLLSKELPATEGTTTPIVDGDTVYIRANMKRGPKRLEAWKLSLGDDAVTAQRVWASDVVVMAQRGPVLKDGLLYAVGTDGGKRHTGLVVVDAADGSQVAELPLKDKAGGYPKLAATDACLVMNGLGDRFTFFSYGRKPTRIAHCGISIGRSGYSPATYHDDVIVARSMNAVYCIKETPWDED